MFNTQHPTAPTQIGEGRPDSAVLFIHGLAGSHETWCHFANHLKAKWTEADCFGLEYDEYYGSQSIVKRIPILRNLAKIRRIIIGPDLATLSRHLRTVVDELCEEYDNVIIIAHSMGGLIARRYIVDVLDETKSVGKVRSLITYATPHHGSILANHYLTFCSAFVPFFIKVSKQIAELSRRNDFIEQLNLNWTKLRVEDKIEFVRVVGLQDWIVNFHSSSYRNDPTVKVIAGKNHYNIIVPSKLRNKDDAFMVTYNYLKNFRKRYAEKLDFQSDFDFEYDSYDFD